MISSRYMVCIESMMTTSGFTSSIEPEIISRLVSETKYSSPSICPIRLARILICFKDSSPEIYNTFFAEWARFLHTCKSNVDFPIPGSPPTRTRLPFTIPLPRTRSSSPNPVVVRSWSSMEISEIRTGAAPRPGIRILSAACDFLSETTGSSTNEFHALHAGHCPIHLPDS